MSKLKLNMKNKITPALVAIVTAVVMVSCSEPSTTLNQNDAFGIVLKTVNKEKIILIQDGRTINPITGIPGFQDIELGTVLEVRFDIASSNLVGNVIDVNVLSYTVSSQSEFIRSVASIGARSNMEGDFVGDALLSQDPSDSLQDLASNMQLGFLTNNQVRIQASCPEAICFPLSETCTYQVTGSEFTFVGTETEHSISGTYEFILATSPNGDEVLHLWRTPSQSDHRYILMSLIRE